MNAFIYGALLQWKLDLRDRFVLLTYYLIPLVFFGFMGAIFTSINPGAKATLIQTMTIFGVTMGAFLGTPAPLVELYGGEIIKAYKVGGIPLWMAAVNNFISAFAHLFLMSVFLFLLAPLAFKAQVPANLGLYFISLAIFIIVCVSIGTLLGLYVRSASRLTMFSQLLFLPSLMLSGIMFPANLLPGVFQTVGKILPATWGLKIMTVSTLDITLFLPLLLMLVVTLVANVYKISRVGIE